jgi:hypothetical protein
LLDTSNGRHAVIVEEETASCSSDHNYNTIRTNRIACFIRVAPLGSDPGW